MKQRMHDILRRFAEWAALFTEGGRFLVWGECYEGRATIEREIGGMQPPGVPGKHALLQPVIDFEGPEHARAWTDMSVMTQPAEGIVTATIGRYHDELVRRDGTWFFEQRAIVMAGESVPEGVAPSPAR